MKTLPSALIVLSLGASLAGAQSAAAPHIPLMQGLHIDWAWHGDTVEGDYKPWLRVTEVNDASVTILMHAYKGAANGGHENVTIDTKMMRGAMRDAPIYRQVWITTDPEIIANTTSMVVSAAVLHALTTGVSAPLTIIDERASDIKAQNTLNALGSLVKALSSDDEATGTPYVGALSRVERGPVPFSVLVNDRPVMLPAIHARGNFTHGTEKDHYDLYILDDPTLPLVLAVDGLDATGGRVVQINFPDSTRAPTMERALAARQPVNVYEIYFDFNSAKLQPESDGVLKEIGAIMNRHPDWRLDVTGHTDSIGGSGPGNRLLSAHRAEAVKAALTSRFGIAPDRLSSDGAGNSAPLATNATLEGRARNRRVELTRR